MRWRIMALLLRLFGSAHSPVRASPDRDRRVSDALTSQQRALEALERELALYHHPVKDHRQ